MVTAGAAAFMLRSAARAIIVPAAPEIAVSNLLFFRRSCSYRSAAVDLTRKARDLPLGPERRAVRQLARAFSDLAKTEAWLEGQAPRHGSPTYDREYSHRAVGAR